MKWSIYKDWIEAGKPLDYDDMMYSTIRLWRKFDKMGIDRDTFELINERTNFAENVMFALGIVLGTCVGFVFGYIYFVL